MTGGDILAIERLSKKYNEANMPQYLSYPTSNWWKSRVTEALFVEKCRESRIPYLYFHFPYCKKPCYYCMCYRQIAGDESEKELYLDYLKREIEAKVDKIGAGAFESVRHIHWGGGTPTWLTCRQIEEVYRLIERRVKVAEGATLSIEAHPDEAVVTAEKLELLRGLGFRQISFGVQDFDPRVQQAINRDCSIEAVASLVERSKKLGFRVNIDLCYGLPFQGQNELERTIREVIALAPDRVELLVYVHYPAIFPMQKKIPASAIPNSFVRVLQSMLAEELFEGNGYRKVGYDHFVKPTDPLYEASAQRRVMRDFMGYSIAQKKEFIGFGIAAIGAVRDAYFHNVMSLDAYYRAIDEGRIPIDEGHCHLFEAEDRIRNGIIQKDVMSDFEIDKRPVAGAWGIDFDRHFAEEMARLSDMERDRLLDLSDPEVIRITPIGRHFARHVAHAFDGYYNGKRRQ